ncbi:MAG: ribosome maturation factor RimP [Deltaproteobacteria bacterium]|nr:ribosome maturation factor RimP [Deltaproteobacteria bacterium]
MHDKDSHDRGRGDRHGAGSVLGAVRELARAICAGHGLELDDVRWHGGPGGPILRVTIDRRSEGAPAPQGPTLDDCVRVSRDLSGALDVEDIIGHSYHLEVSSPGAERPLRTADDFRRRVGQLARVKLARPAPDGQRLLRGRIVEASGEQLRVDVDGKSIEVSFAEVAEARLVLGPGPRPPRAAPAGRAPGRTGRSEDEDPREPRGGKSR